jgi:hypothetical protein
MKNSIKLLTAGLYALALLLTGCGQNSPAKNQVTLDELNRVVSMTFMSPTGPIRNVEELTNFPTFKGRLFPKPPAGKKFVINNTTHKVMLVDQ